jgi:WXG100 family type VII secretion target
MTENDMLVVNFAAMQKASADIQTALNTLTSQLAQVERDAGPLVAAWDGDARGAYDIRQAKWQRASADLSDILRDIKRALDDSTADYQHTEKRNTSLFQ